MPPTKSGAAKKATAKQASKKAAAKQPTNQGLMKAVQPSAALAAIVGNTPLPRTEITKKIWDYINPTTTFYLALCLTPLSVRQICTVIAPLHPGNQSEDAFNRIRTQR